jgi:hypothetical protein
MEPSSSRAPRRTQRLEKVLPTGWSLNMHLVPLEGSGLLVYSPTWLGDDTFARVERHGEPTLLVAPNYFHHLSLRRFRERYPKAVVCAHEGALRRLEAKGHPGVSGPEAAAPLLPKSVRLVPCEGTKSGEIWVSAEEGAARTLVVGDAFFNVERETSGVMGVALRLLKTAPGLSVGSTWRWLQLSDRAHYVAWATRFLTELSPTRLCVCHGEDVVGEDLAGKLVELITRRLS